MRGARARAGDFIRSGPSGAPPPNGRAWEVGDSSPYNRLSRYAGARFYDRVAAKSWVAMSTSVLSWVDEGKISVLGLISSNLVALSNVIILLDVGVDPSVAPGVAGPVGALGVALDGLKAWQKYGTPNTAWRSLNETRVKVTASGGPSSVITASIAATASQSLILRFDGSGGDVFANLQLNGAGVIGCGNNAKYGNFVPATGAVPMGKLNTGSMWMEAKLGPSVGGWRSLVGAFGKSDLYDYNGRVTGSVSDPGAITSVGLAVAGNNIDNGSVLKVRVLPEGEI